jgi:hypothetical protein
MSTLGKSPKRADVYVSRNQREKDQIKKRQLDGSSTFVRGSETDAWGRFVGHGDIARGLDFFNQNRLASEEIK